MSDRPPVVKESEQLRAKALMLAAQGSTATAIGRALDVPTHQIRNWMNQKEFLDARAEVNKQIAERLAADSNSVMQKALKAVEQQIADGDGKLALAFLEKTGALKTIGNELEFKTEDTKNALDAVNITINTHGATIDTTKVTDAGS